MLISEPVLKCLSALDAAETDTEKLAALFLVPKLVKGADCDKNARSHIMKVFKRYCLLSPCFIRTFPYCSPTGNRFSLSG